MPPRTQIAIHKVEAYFKVMHYVDSPLKVSTTEVMPKEKCTAGTDHLLLHLIILVQKQDLLGHWRLFPSKCA